MSCGDCSDEHPLRVARRRYDELMQLWGHAQRQVIDEAAASKDLPVPLARLVAQERRLRGELLEAQAALTSMMYPQRR